MSTPFTREERAALLARIADVEAQMYPAEGPKPGRPLAARLRDTYYALLGEYSDRLPRVPLSVCPFTGQPLVRSFDPFGFDGPWWQKDRTFTPEEPGAPPTFRVILGAVDLRGREPVEAGPIVLAGPAAPYVVPRLLGLPGMVAVMNRVEMQTGDVAWPIAYFSSDATPPWQLHQDWTRPERWFKAEDGSDSWLLANDVWDFDLAPWIERGQLRWVAERGGKLVALGPGESCPWLELPGDRVPQELAGGVRELGDPPTGEAAAPFELE